MPRYDIACPAGHEHEIVTRWDDRHAACPTCGEPTERVWRTSFPNIIGDEIDYVEHNLTSTPIRFTSKAERKRLMKQLGKVEKIEHVGVPGTDKSPHTSRWT